jgi:hypothetical protein
MFSFLLIFSSFNAASSVDAASGKEILAVRLAPVLARSSLDRWKLASGVLQQTIFNHGHLFEDYDVDGCCEK